MHLVYPLPPPQKKKIVNYCFQFLLDITVLPGEIEDNGYGLCENGKLHWTGCLTVWRKHKTLARKKKRVRRFLLPELSHVIHDV